MRIDHTRKRYLTDVTDDGFMLNFMLTNIRFDVVATAANIKKTCCNCMFNYIVSSASFNKRRTCFSYMSLLI